MFDKPKVVTKPYVAPKKAYVAPKQMHRPKPVVKHKGIGLPPAQPGQCFAKVKQPAKFKNVVKKVQVSPAVNKRVQVRGPQYTWINKKVLARPATERYQYIPAQYRTVTKKVLVKPAHYTWQKGKTGPVTRIDNMTGEILCRVKVPAVYRTVTQKVVARAAQRIKRHVPAVYKTVKQKKLTSPAQFRNINTPARFVNKSYRVKVSDERYQWKPIACKTQPKQAKHVQPQRHAVSHQQQQQTAAFNNEQKVLKQLWMKQEAQRQRQAAAKQQQTAAQKRQAHQARQRQAQAAQAARQQQALAAQRQRQAKQQALVAQQQRQAKQRAMTAQQQHQAKQQAAVAQQQRQAKQLAEQRRIAQMRKTSHTQQSYAAPKVRNVSVNKTVQAKAQPARVQAAPKQTFIDNPATPLTRENAVFRIQKALQQRGYNPGTLDGRLGPTTVKALTSFQESQGLKTGTLNKDTLRALSLVN